MSLQLKTKERFERVLPGARAHAADSEIAVDAHVHLSDPARDLAALAAAAENFGALAPVTSGVGVLMLAETHDQDAFSRLRARADAERSAIRLAAEPCSLWFTAGRMRLLIVAGRQIVTAERLEVLALGTCERIPDGLPLDRVLGRAASCDAIAVLPWGCGKWLGNRRRLVRGAMTCSRALAIFLGDNGGRPSLWREPLFRTAAERNVRILPGSDPLPVRNDWRRIGRFGFAIPASLSDETPAADLKSALRDPQRPIRPYGSLESIGRFLVNQSLIRLKRGGARARHEPER